MVGLPARGKTFTSQKSRSSSFALADSNRSVARYLQWLGIPCRVFNVGDYRRNLHGIHRNADFFDPNNKDGEAARREAATEALKDMIRWFDENKGRVAVLDATNATQERRRHIAEACAQHGVHPMFIESFCDDADLIRQNVAAVKLTSPEYRNMDPEKAVDDFIKRIDHYGTAYQTMSSKDDADLTFIRLVNVGKQVQMNLIQGYLQSRIVYYLMNLHIKPRDIFFTRHGESMFNVEGKIGGDALLSPRGQQYADLLPQLVHDHIGTKKLTVWTSTLRRTIQTASKLEYPKMQWKVLDELNAGKCDGMTYEEIEARYPEDYENRDEDKFNYRYQGGESYRDVVIRLEPVIMELERQENILIVCHQAVIRCLYAYFLNLSHDELPYIKIPLHTIIKLTPKAYGCDEARYSVPIEAVDTHRPKPKRKTSVQTDFM